MVFVPIVYAIVSNTSFILILVHDPERDKICTVLYRPHTELVRNLEPLKILEESKQGTIRKYPSVEQVSTNTLNNSNSSSTNIYNLSWKNMHYIWKLYLSSINVPNMMYSNNLKVLLKTQLTFTENTNDIVFTNVTSKFLPSVSSFLSFWEKHIIITSESDEEYEIDEISSLYKVTNKTPVNISDKEIIKMIWHYFYPNVEVIDNKYVTNIHCNLWSKHDDINEMLAFYKQQQHPDVSLISFDELYQNYKSYIQAKNAVENLFHPIVSKHFFEKFLSQYLAEYIKFDKFVSSDWFLS